MELYPLGRGVVILPPDLAGHLSCIDFLHFLQEAATELILTASQLGHAAVINTLARLGADLEVTDEVRGGRPLMHAATNGHAAAAAALLKVPPNCSCGIHGLSGIGRCCLFFSFLLQGSLKLLPLGAVSRQSVSILLHSLPCLCILWAPVAITDLTIGSSTSSTHAFRMALTGRHATGMATQP